MRRMKPQGSMVTRLLWCSLMAIGIVCLVAVESPQYTVVLPATEFEVRLYASSFWMSASLRGTSFERSTREGFHRLYQYMHGANLNQSVITLTAPVLTSVNQSYSGGSSEYSVSFYLLAKFRGLPPQPNPALNLEVDEWKACCIAVRKFSGFARDDNVAREVEALLAGLKNYTTGGTLDASENAYAIAQYNSPHDSSGRVNEVWLRVGFPAEDGCMP